MAHQGGLRTYVVRDQSQSTPADDMSERLGEMLFRAGTLETTEGHDRKRVSCGFTIHEAQNAVRQKKCVGKSPKSIYINSQCSTQVCTYIHTSNGPLYIVIVIQNSLLIHVYYVGWYVADLIYMCAFKLNRITDGVIFYFFIFWCRVHLQSTAAGLVDCCRRLYMYVDCIFATICSAGVTCTVVDYIVFSFYRQTPLQFWLRVRCVGRGGGLFDPYLILQHAGSLPAGSSLRRIGSPNY